MRMLKTKLLVSLLIMVLLLNNAFAAVVADNDGTTFTTKLEFDKLKYSFNKQIEDYNNSIDGKIDGSIAEYIRGVNKSIEPKNLYDELVKVCNAKPIWHQTIETGLSSVTCETRCTKTLHHTGDVVDNIHYDVMWTIGGSSTNGWFEPLVWIGSSIVWPSGGGWVSRTNTKWHGGYNFTGGDVVYTLSSYAGALGVNGYYNAAGQSIKKKNWQSQSFDVVTNGAGELWQTQDLGRRTVLKKYCTSWYPIHNIDIWFHTYLKYDIPAGRGDVPAYVADDGKSYKTAHAEKTVKALPGAIATDGIKYSDDNTKIGDYAEIKCTLMAVNDGNNYLNDLYSIKTNPTLYYVDEGYQGESDTTAAASTINVEDGTFYDIYYTTTGGVQQKNTLKGGKFNFNPLKVTVNSKKLSEFSTNAVSSVAGVDVPNCAGIPIFETYENEQTVKVTYKINSAHNNKVSVVCADKMFENGDVPAANILFSKEINANTDETFSVFLEKKGKCWLFIKNNTNDEALVIEDLTLK